MPAIQVKELTTADEVFANYRAVRARMRALRPVERREPVVVELVRPPVVRFVFSYRPHTGPIFIPFRSSEWDAYVHHDSTPHYPAVHHIVRVVAEEYGVTFHDILSHCRLARVVRPRHVVCFLARKLTLNSFPAIGRLVGDRDHTTAMHGYRQVDKQRRTDPIFHEKLRLLASKLTGGTIALD